MANKIQQRRDTAENWAWTNPILSSGEFGFEIETGKLKVGNGFAQWNELSYFAGSLSAGDTPPLNPIEFQLWFDVVSGRMYIYFSNTWVDTNPETGGNSITSGVQPPPEPSVGNLWFDTTSGRLFIYYSNAWVDTNPETTDTTDQGTGGGSSVISSSTPPDNPRENDLWYDKTRKRLYLYNSSIWVDASPSDGTTLRYGLVADRAIVNQLGIQSLFGVGVRVSDSTRYEYTITGMVYKNSSIPAIFKYALAGTAIVANHTFTVLCSESLSRNNSFGSLTNQPALSSVSLTSSYSSPINISSGAVTGATYYNFVITGVLEVTTNGTVNPQIAFDSLPGNGTVMSGTKIKLIPVSSTGINTAVGTWTV